MSKREWWPEEPPKESGPNPYANKPRWRKKSKSFRKRNALCEVWLRFGRHVKCDVTDHIIRVEDGGAWWDEENYMAMSHFWHNKKRQLESNGLKLKTVDGRGGKIPADREEIINLFFEKYKHDFE